MTNTTTRNGEGLAPSPLHPSKGATVRTAPASPSKAEKKLALYLAQGCRCWYCDGVMTYYRAGHPHLPAPRDYATWEHITPIRRDNKTRKARKGTPKYLKAPENLVLACWQCNNDRGTKPLPEFIALLRERGKRFGIVSRIRHLVDDRLPQPWQAEAFDEWMRGLLDRPASPAEALKRLPPELEAVLLPDPAPPVPPVSRLVRLLRTWRHRLSLVLPLGRREGFKAGVALMAKYMAPGVE